MNSKPICEHMLENTPRIFFIIQATKKLLQFYDMLCFMFHKMLFISQFYVFHFKYHSLLLNHVLKFKYPPW